jgi:hypothetical protein
MSARSLTHCEVLLAGLVIRTRSKPAAVGLPSKKDDKSTANGDDAEKTKASDEVLRSCPPLSFAFLVGRVLVFAVFRRPAIDGRTRVGVSTNCGAGGCVHMFTNNWWAEHCSHGHWTLGAKDKSGGVCVCV